MGYPKAMASHADKLLSYLAELPVSGPVAVAWSGGVDSTVVAVAAEQVFGERFVAVTVYSDFLSRRERERVEAFMESYAMNHRFIAVDLLSHAGIRSNGPDRCYWCKKAMLEAIGQVRAEVILDGTNASDNGQRPGLRALREFEVVSPLLRCGIVKDEVRAIARQWNLSVAKQPSESCLATRVGAGLLTLSTLQRIEGLENHLHELGFNEVRARVDDMKVIIEVPRTAMHLLEHHHERIRKRIMEEGWTLVGYGTSLEPGA